MKNSKIQSTMAALLVAGVIGVSSVSFAAEDAAGVKHEMDATIADFTAAVDHAKQGHKDEALTSLKSGKQHSKSITGAANSKGKQTAMEKATEAQRLLKDGDTAGAAVLLEESLNMLKVEFAKAGG